MLNQNELIKIYDNQGNEYIIEVLNFDNTDQCISCNGPITCINCTNCQECEHYENVIFN